MTRHSTERLLVAVFLSLAGAVVSVLLGMPEVGLFVAPWVVLCALGLAQHQTPSVTVIVEPSEDRLMVDDELELKVRLQSSGDGLVSLRPLPSSNFGMDATGTGDHTVVLALRGDRPTEHVLVLPATEWGTHDVGRVRVGMTAPFGLFRLSGEAAQRRSVHVHPTPQQLQDLLTPWLVRRVSGTHRSRESAQGIEYADIRQFGPGDSVRDINWRASARSQDLWISQRHPDRATDVVLLVDSFVESGHDVRAVFSMIVEASVALAESHLGATDRVGLIEFGGVVRWVSPGTGRVQLQKLTDALLSTGLYANAADKDLPDLPVRALPPRSFVVVFSPLLDDRFVDAVFQMRGRGHDVAVVECLPFGREASGGPNDAEAQRKGQPDLTRTEALARSVWDAERSLMRDRMAEQGIAVASWDGIEHLSVVLSQLTRRRRGTARIGARR